MSSEISNPKSDTPEKNLPASSPPPNGNPQPLNPVTIEDDDILTQWDNSATRLRCSIDDSTPAGRQLVSRLFLKADKPMADAIGAVMPVKNFLAHACTVADLNTGELIQKIRLCLMLDDGTTVDTMSAPFIKGFAYLANRFGVGPWDPCLMIEAKKLAGKKPGGYYVCFESEEPYNVTPKEKRPGKK
jgi:hypothetical protein